MDIRPPMKEGSWWCPPPAPALAWPEVCGTHPLKAWGRAPHCGVVSSTALVVIILLDGRVSWSLCSCSKLLTAKGS